jgi:hypothetical protein
MFDAVELVRSSKEIDWAVTVQALASPVSAIAAAVALFLNWIATKNNTKTRELDIFYKVFKDVQELQDTYYKDYADKTDAQIKNWLSIFFNAQECMAFLINKKHLTGDFKDFYKEGFITFYKQIFMVKADTAEKEDPIQYPEIKKLYISLTCPVDDIIQRDKEMFNQ